MATARTQGYRPGLVDLASGQISREIFVNGEIYAEEQEKIFARAWLFVGHESQIPNPATSEVGVRRAINPQLSVDSHMGLVNTNLTRNYRRIALGRHVETPTEPCPDSTGGSGSR